MIETQVNDRDELARADERDLLPRHCNGDGDAFAELLARYRAPVFSYLARCGVTEEDRRDLFQEAFVRIHRAAGRYRPELPLHPWLFTIVANLVRNHQRRERVRRLVFREPPAAAEEGAEPRQPTAEEPGGDRRLAAREQVAWLERQLARLSPPQRQVLLLVSVQNLELREVAQALELPLNTVKSHLRRARRTLVRLASERDVGRCSEESS